MKFCQPDKGFRGRKLADPSLLGLVNQVTRQGFVLAQNYMASIGHLDYHCKVQIAVRGVTTRYLPQKKGWYWGSSDIRHSVGKWLKMSDLNFSIGELKVTRLATLFDRQLQAFPDSPKRFILSIFNQLLSISNVEGDFFFDFPTPWALLHLFYNGEGHP